MPQNLVKTQLRCSGRQQTVIVCVPVSRGVPEPLRCIPGGAAGRNGGPSLCEDCTRLLSDPPRLTEAVNDLARHGWEEWIRQGAVIIEC